MAVKVSNLKIQLQNGTDNTYFATWHFSGTTKGSTATAIKAGSIVKIKSGATWYGGQSIDPSISSLRWYVLQINEDRAVLNKSPDNSGYAIMSPINTKYLTLSSGSSSSDPVDRSTLDHYNVIWEYYTGNGGVWFRASESDVKINQATYSPPDNALSIRVKVKPVSTTHEVTNTVTSGTGKDATTKTVTTQVPNWSGTTVTEIFNIPSETSKPPEKPSSPSVEIKNTKLTATLEGITDVRADKIKFYVRKFNQPKNYKTCEVTVRNQRASFTCIVEAGFKYVVACKAINVWGSTKLFSKEHSDWTSPVGTSPKAPGAITTLKAKSDTEVQITWGGQPTAETYDIEYTTEKRYFDKSSDQVKTTSTNKNIYSTYITGLEPGKEWFFRVRSVNGQGTSSWTAIKSIKLGKAPGVPTTWSSTTTATVGDDLKLYWVHNSEDGSSQTYAQLELTINGVKTIKTIKNTTDEEKKDLTSSYTIPTTSYTEGTKILWRVRTKGILGTLNTDYGWSDWSIQRTIDVYSKPTLELDIINKEGTTLDTIKSFPFYIKGTAGPSTQSAIGYHIEITANNSYETVDSMGNRKLIGEGDSVYSKYFDITGELSVEMSANNIDLEDGISYSLTCTVSMDSGLTAEETLTFAVKWGDETYDVDASISIDPETFAAYIRPYCTTQKEVNITNTTTGETETVTDDVLVEGVTMSVYRREYNGEFTEIATGLDNMQNIVVTDPHPALDYARYRIVATTELTGAISFYDPPGYPVNCKSVIIQWDEEWTSFDNFNIEETIAEPAWTGSMLKLPYNIDVSDKNNPDVSLVEYIGRKRPVTYYGTHIGETASWSVAIPKDDKETLYALRRLAIYMGDVYVREPSGSGYWANVKVSFSQTHCELTIPVTLELTRVEGGI